jgi:hypothetical protein
MHYLEKSNQYFGLPNQLSDVYRRYSTASQTSEPWILRNMLPLHLELWKEPDYLYGQKEKFLTLKPNEVRSLSPNSIQDGDKLQVYYLSPHNSNILMNMMPEYTFRGFLKSVKIGAVEYTSDGGHGGLQSTRGDMRGVWLCNRLAIPLGVIYQGNLVAELGGYNGTEYMGGGGSTLYFDNSGAGIDYGDEFAFVYSLKERRIPLFSVTVDDDQCSTMFIGVVSTEENWARDPDNAVYKVNRPDVIDIAYYLPIGGGNSRDTNVYAPF